jgi:hypothetical protein
MTPDTRALLRDALALDADQRAVVAHSLLASLHPSIAADDTDDTWRSEVERRFRDVREGAAELVDADDHYARLRASLAE